MNKLEIAIKKEIEDIHDIFVKWFTGDSNKTELENKIAARFHEGTKFISTKGVSINYENLMMMFRNGYGKNSPDFKIAISDVEVLHEVGDHILATYVEWQTSDANPEESCNYTARKTTLVISKAQPFKWLHIHETMLPKPDQIIEKWKS